MRSEGQDRSRKARKNRAEPWLPVDVAARSQRLERLDEDVARLIAEAGDIPAQPSPEAKARRARLKVVIDEAARQQKENGTVTENTRRDILELVEQLSDATTVDESKYSDYTGSGPSSEAAVTPGAASGMRDDFNTKVKKAKAENLARGNARPATLQLATYRALLRNVDLLNPELAEDEQLRRAKRLVKAYGRVRERRPNFHDKHKQLQAAFSIVNSHQYERTGKPKREAAKRLAAG
jgi:hypothetical protein